MSPWLRKEQIGDCTLYLGDCLQVMPLLGKVDAVVTDPPYGIGEGGDKNRSRSKLASVGNYKSDQWDKEVNQAAIDLAVSISKHAVIFGGNYYSLPPTSCWLVWDKQNGSNDFADCELAWTNLNKAVRRIVWAWHGFIRRGEMDKVKTPTFRQHPTQKPVGVMTWCLSHINGARTVLDPFMGSGTTGVACAKMGRKFIGIELDPVYFEIACQRIRRAYEQPDMFVDANTISSKEEILTFGFDDPVEGGKP